MVSKLIKDLSHVPNIVAGLGLGIAEAQAHFDLDYVRSLERLAVLAQSLLKNVPVGDTEADKDRNMAMAGFLKEMLLALAPSRYQFTETTLNVKLDLAQTLDVAVQGGVSAGIGAVAVNASFAVGFGYDYRAAAECKTVINAFPMDRTAMNALIERAKELSNAKLELPPRSDVSTAVEKAAGDVFTKLFNVAPPAIETKP